MPRYAPLSLVLSTLITVLSPTPIPASVPAALKLLAHLQLLDRQLIAEAARALDAHKEIVAEIYGECRSPNAVNERKQEFGALSNDEIQVLKRIIKRGRRVEDRLFIASMWIRHWVRPWCSPSAVIADSFVAYHRLAKLFPLARNDPADHSILLPSTPRRASGPSDSEEDEINLYQINDAVRSSSLENIQECD
jgi:hypothetical protein